MFYKVNQSKYNGAYVAGQIFAKIMGSGFRLPLECFGVSAFSNFNCPAS